MDIFDKDKAITGPHQGQIVASRVHGTSMDLYGSPIPHNEAVLISVHHSCKNEDTGRDWYFNTGNPIVELYLSPHQWAEFLTRMNVGSGTPCTIRYTERNGYVPPAAIPETKRLDGSVEIEEATKTVQAKMSNLIKTIEGLAAKGKAGKRELDALLHDAKCERDNIRPNMQFVLKMIKERASYFVAAAKMEIAALIESAPHIKMIQEADKTKQLEAPEYPKIGPNSD